MDQKAIDEISKEELFEIKQKFFREIPHPKLILKSMKLLQKTKYSSEFTYPKIAKRQPLAALLESQINFESYIKLKVANANDVSMLERVLLTLFENQIRFIADLAIYAPQKIEKAEVKMSEPFPVYEMLKALEASGINEKDIPTTINDLNSIENPKFDALLVNIIKARRIISYG